MLEDWHGQMLSALGVPPGPAWPDRFGENLRLWLATHDRRPVRALSLFSGGGGLDIAFHDAGFHVVEMVEIEKRFAATLEANARRGEMLTGTVKCVDIREYQPPADLGIDFIIGGPPCQTFSAAGRRASGVKGTTDPRGTLFQEYVRILQALRPVGFLFENVYGITGAEGGEPWRHIQQAFRDAGYVIHFRVLDAADYGVPQHRERLFIIGLRDDADAIRHYRFPCPTHGPDAYTARAFYSAGEAVMGADPTEENSLLMRGKWGHLICDIPPGLNYSFYTREMGHPTPVFAWRSKFSDLMYKADPLTPVRTVKAQGGAYTGPFSWENRHFSTAEMKRLQTFPDGYELVGPRQARIHQIGNSVPPQIGRILALSILNQIFDTALPFPMHYLEEGQTLGFRTRKRTLTEKYAAKARAAIAAMPELSPSSVPCGVFVKREIRYLTQTFALVNDAGQGNFPVQLHYGGDQLTPIISSSPLEPEAGRDDGFSYSISIEPAQGMEWPIPLQSVTLCGSGRAPALLTALWKAFEETVEEKYGIADLVQLSGYYQYAPKMRAWMYMSSMAPPAMEWRILAKVIGGIGVSSQMPSSVFAEAWGVPEDEVVPALKTLRSMGYEVRNSNTNPQILPGEYLIPYAFPTLTPRSIQLRKTL